MRRIVQRGFVTTEIAFRIYSRRSESRWDGPSSVRNFSSVYRSMENLVRRALVLEAMDSRPVIWITSEVLRGKALPRGLYLEAGDPYGKLKVDRPGRGVRMGTPSTTVRLRSPIEYAATVYKPGFRARLYPATKRRRVRS